MNGPIILFICFVVIILAVKHHEHVKRVFAGVGASAQGMKGLLGGLFSSKGLIAGLLILGAAGVLYAFGSIPGPSGWLPPWRTPSLASAVRWSQANWFPLLVLWGILATFVALYAPKAAQKVLQWLLAGIAFLLLIGLPMWVGVEEFRHAREQPRKEKLPILRLAPGGKSEPIAVPYPMRVVIHGKDFQYHCMYADGHEETFRPGERPCSDGDMPFVYATNDRKDAPNVLTYSYAK